MDCTVWNEYHRTRLACRRPGPRAHRDIERGKVPSAARVACIARSACTSLDQNSNKQIFERSEFLIATSQKKKFARVRVCSTSLGFSVGYACVLLILVSVWGTYYVPDTYVPGISRPKSHHVRSIEW